jgi:putative glutamine amidotransferase
MSKKPLIGTPLNSFDVEGKLAPARWTGNCGSPQALLDLGALSILMPPLDDVRMLREYYDMVSGLLMTGGADIDPAIYGEKKVAECGPTCPRRDLAERRLLNWALEDKKPVLGICRGHQMMNVTLGGTLYQDIPTQIETDNRHIVDDTLEDWYVKPHKIKVEPGTKLSSIIGSGSFDVNSVHHQCVDKIGNDLVVSAKCCDSIIEAIEHKDQSRFFIGIQCHPEVLWQEDAHWKKLFEAFITACDQFGYEKTPDWVI